MTKIYMIEECIMENKERTASFKDFMELLNQTKVNKGMFIAGIVLSFFGMIGSLIVPLLTQSFIDGFNTEMFTTGIAVVIIALFLFSAVLDGFAYYILAKVGQTIIKRLRELVWDKFLKLPVKYYDATKSGESVSRLVNDTAIIKNLITSHFPQVINGTLSIVGAVVILMTCGK